MQLFSRNTLMLLVLASATPALASSDAAWEEFHKDIQKKCSDAVAETIRRPLVAIDTTGTEELGLAIVYGRAKANKAPVSFICTVDKKTGKVAIGSELGEDVLRVRRPKPQGADDKARKADTTQTKAKATAPDAADDAE